MFNVIEKTIDLGDGRSISVETGKMARQADGAVKVQMGNTILLATVVSAKEAREDVDFMPLSVEYKEKYASVGRFPGGFLKRETRPSDYEILIARLVDRALRPLFPEDYHADTFVTINLISADPEIYPDALAGFAASAALSVSDIPFAGPISEARVARADGQFVINPTKTQIEAADIDIIVGATMENIMMVEGEMSEVPEEDMLEAIKFAHEAIKDQCRLQLELMKETGNMTKREYAHEENDEGLRKKVFEATYDKALEVAKSSNDDKQARMDAFAKIVDDFIATLPEEDEVDTALIKKYYHDVEKEVVRKVILEDGLRLDGRKTDEVRPISCEVDVLPGPHGSALFTRGETQSLTTVTLGTKLDEQMRDGVMITGSDKIVLHYNFPPFSTGDARPVRGVSRREIGHGNLALRALKPMIPTDPEENPYAVRIVSDILESNGSSSMATVCAGTLAMMDCGLKLKKPVSGIAMGLITDQESGKYAVLSDILGDEDHLGDMDFKVTGTRDGVTACQMDIKVDGLSYEVMKQALQQANEGRMHILDKMAEAISEPREDFKPHTPRIKKITIPKDAIGAVIGSGGSVIQELQEMSDTTITITEEDDLGIVEVFGDNLEKITKALDEIEAIIKVPEPGEVYTGKVVSIVSFGAFVEFLPGKEGLLHVSELDWKRIEKTEDVLKEGDEVEVKILRIENGKYKLSRRALMPKPEGYKEPERRERNDRRGDRRGGGGDRRRGGGGRR